MDHMEHWVGLSDVGVGGDWGTRPHWLREVGRVAGYAGVGYLKGLPPYGGALLCEALAVEGTQHWLTPLDFESLSPAALDLVLTLHGLEVQRTRFVRRAEGMRSAWTLARALWPHIFSRGTAAQQDFAGMAATALWRRWLPDQPCAERAGWILREIDPLRLDAPPTPERQLTAWERAWAAVDALLPPGTARLSVAQRFSATRVPFEEWLLECAETFAIDPWGERPEWLRRAAALLEAALRRVRFPWGGVGDLLRGHLARLWLAIGEGPRALDLLRRLHQGDPDATWIYDDIARAFTAGTLIAPAAAPHDPLLRRALERADERHHAG